MAKTAIERVATARHPERPYTLDLLSSVFTDFVEIHGDRRFSNDPAMVCGFAKLDDVEVAVIGQQKGRDTNSRKHRNFGMPKPEGYRKALRLMRMAEKFGRPVITFIDTPGAYPGIDAEERGQAEAIALNLREMAGLKVPIIVVVIGEGGSGGALAIGVGDRVLMMENAIYSVISPEGCAAILWKDASQASRAADNLRLTAEDLKRLGVIDEIIPEPVEWKTNDNSEGEPANNEVNENLKISLLKHLKELLKFDASQRLSRRYEKFRKMGEFL
ncbi:MAG: acetyl-CoA carboxylase carboxyltransferase subunit alpha [Acidobacteriota bacterium]|nr:acetyl-CoA carboxylase carboxyltransferase subunit alpha [Acidobacteriota bacterium]